MKNQMTINKLTGNQMVWASTGRESYGGSQLIGHPKQGNIVIRET